MPRESPRRTAHDRRTAPFVRAPFVRAPFVRAPLVRAPLVRAPLAWAPLVVVAWAACFAPGAARADDPAPAAAASESATSVTARIDPIPPGIEAVYRGAAPVSVEQLREMEAHQRQLVAKAMPCIVGLQIGQAQGSGVIVDANGLILTAAHVVQRPNQSVNVIFPDGTIVRGRTLGLDRASDAGMVRINGPPPSDGGGGGANGAEPKPGGWPFLEVGGSEKLAVGQWIVTLGHPGGYQRGRNPVVRVGRILSLEGDLVVTDGPLVGGDSGGPLIDMSGKVVGIHSRIGGSLTANMHVPSQAFRDAWDRLAAGEMWGDVPRGSPYIGVQGDPDNDRAKIVYVEPSQPADRAGLKAGDVVTRCDDTPITDFSSLAAIVSDSEPGRKVVLEVERGDETLKLDLVIGRRR